MQDAFALLVVIVVVVGGMVAVYAVATSGHAYREIGKGGLDVPIGDEAPTAPAAPATPDDRDEEIRELLEARNARRAGRGEPPLDVDAQLAALTSGGGGARAAPAGPKATRELRDELRALVEARNRRRAGAGLPALDVDAEVERRLRDLN
jgi:uncharacterized protein YkwD